MSIGIKGKHICFTGKLEGFTRAELEEAAKEYGFIIDSKVTRTTDYLVSGKQKGDAKSSTKLDEARKLGIRIWEPEDFIMMLSQDEADGLPTSDAVAAAKAKRAAEEELKKQAKVSRAAWYADRDDAGMF